MKLKFRLVWVLAMGLALSACEKETGCKNVAPADEETVLRNYISSKGYTAEKHSSGLLYQIINPGTGAKPTINSQVFVSYRLLKLDDTQLELVVNPATTGFGLNSLVEAWKIGMPLIAAGGSIRLFCPSSLAYGCQGSPPNIPANTPLFFEISLASFR
ncbi:MAG: FKBP-type peptidylprolyl isomerase [Bacteroidetes bacterium]|nr:MAG: FKBP-type peptidylprolyl isomerase [Bacteroidota bacterium]